MPTGPGRRVSALAPFVAGIGLMGSIGAVHAGKLAVDTFHATLRLLFETPEQRRIGANGDCGTRGYGYLRRVTARLPDPTAVPIVRSPSNSCRTPSIRISE